MSKGCVIFDFDGVIADTEAMHWTAYNQTFAAHQNDIGGEIVIERERYFGRYIVYGDREGFWHMLRDHGRAHDEAIVEKLVAAKHALFEHGLSTFAEPLPGVRELLEWLAEKKVPRAICSGARRAEILLLLEAFKLRHHFDEVISIEDVRNGKPAPEGYELAFHRLNVENDAELDKALSLVIEDSEGGCAAGKAAGLRVLGVAGSLPLRELERCATFATESLASVDKLQVAAWLGL